MTPRKDWVVQRRRANRKWPDHWCTVATGFDAMDARDMALDLNKAPAPGIEYRAYQLRPSEQVSA